MKPTQSPYLFKGLGAGPQFVADYESQDTIPIDGSKSDGRHYSPFVIRVLPPSILGDNGMSTLVSGVNPQRGPDLGGTIRESNRDLVQYSTTISGVSQLPPSTSTYENMVHNGSAIPGLTSTSVATLSSRYNSARFNQIFGPEVQRSVNGSERDPHTTITPALANDLTALSILLQVKRLMACPPLLMLINPTSMSIHRAKIAQFQERSRYGYLYQAWGEELTKLSLSFKIGAFYAGNPAKSPNLPSGMQRASRRDSAAFQQLMNMLVIFQSAGYIQDTVQKSKANLMVGNIAIEYDQKTYVGHFDTFSFSEEETQQNGGLEFEMEFTAIREFDHAEPSPTVAAMTNPNNPNNGVGRGTISRVGGTAVTGQFFTAPTIGIEGSHVPAQPWSGGVVTEDGIPPRALTTRRV